MSRRDHFFDHPFLMQLQRRRVRRPLAVATVLSVVLFPLYVMGTGDHEPAIVFAATFTVLMLGVVVGIRGLTDICDRSLDERQQMLKDRAFRLAFFLAVFTALAGGLSYAPSAELDRGYGVVQTALLVSLAVVWPAIILAWTLPDEDLDDEAGD